MNIPPAAMAAPQAAPTHAVAAAKNDGDLPATGFAQALFAAGFSDSVSSPAVTIPGTASISTSSGRNAKNTKQQPAKEPAKDGHKSAVTVPVISSLQATLAPPLRIQAFSRETENHEQSGSTQSSFNSKEVTVPVDGPGPAGNPAPEAHADTSKADASRAANADSVHETPPPPTPQNTPAAPSGDLAFAARVQPATAVTAEPNPAPRPVQHDAAASEQNKKTVEKDAAEATVVQPVAAGADASLSSSGQQGSLAQYANAEPTPTAAATSPTAAPVAPLKPVEMKVPETQAKAAAGPLKDISVQVSQPGDQKVEVRVVQESGELRVAVRTGDSDLAHGMQQGLSDLVGRLQDNGFRAEAWRPGGSTVQSGPVLETRSSPSGSQNGDSQSSSGNSHQQQGERRQNQSQRPGWVDELESSIAGGQQSQGVTYGIGS